MSTVQATKCNSCGKLKQEANHWFRGISGTSFHVLTATSQLGQNDKKLDLCGEECAHRVLSEWFQNAGAGRPVAVRRPA